MAKYLLDLIYVAVAILTVFIFTKRGFVESVFKYGRTLMAGILTFLLGPVVGDIIYEKFVYNSVYGFVSDKMGQIVNSAADKVDVNSIIDGLPLLVKQFLNPSDLEAKFGNTITNIEQSAQEFAGAVSEPISNVISNLIAYIIVFLVSLLILLVFGKLLDLIVKLPILNTINTVLGFILGVGSAFLLLAIITYALSLIIRAFGDILSLQTLSSSSYLFGLFDRLHLFDLF